MAKQRGKFGMIDASGKPILEFRYDAINRLPNGGLEIIANQKKGRASAEGKIEIEPRFDYLREVENGRLIASQEGLFGVISMEGLSLIPIQYHGLHLDNSGKFFIGMINEKMKEVSID